MHGRPRKAPTPQEEKALALKASKLRPLQSQFLQFHHNKTYTKEALEVCAKLLEANPEYLTAWNYRKIAVEHILSHSETETETDPESIKSIFSEELRITERALASNYKSYGAWYHRKWVLRKGHSSIDRELQLLEVFLKKDTRNFHAWNYRRFVAALKNRSDEEELQYTTDMISDNFSNYSAWHSRSVLLSQLLEKKVQGYFPKEKVLTEEYNLVHQALFTDPDDQSGWFYHLWLLDQTVKVESPLLVSTWPPHGSSINVSVNGCLDKSALSPMTSFDLSTGTIPVILYFSEAVEGVNSSTINVESIYDASQDLIWTPLSTNNSGRAQAWLTHLNFLEEKIHFLQANSVKVSAGHSQGITSLNGFHCTHPTEFEFTVYVQPPTPQHADLQCLEMISWGDENFHICETHLKESSPIKFSDQLENNEDNESTAYKCKVETIANEIALFRELLSEANCKIGKLTLARLLMAHDVITSYNKSSDTNKSVHFEEVLELYCDLMNSDPPHSQFYKDEYSLVLLQQLTSNPESLLRHCYHYRDSSSSSIHGYICLRLCNLSISRIGSIKQLLWIQMLDLSHNQLHSIEGLEAMQLLSCLNLSHNQIGTFSALEPLKLLKSLKVLNISYNEIGAHSVDTRRYLCSSPLSHTVGSDWSFSEFAIDGVDVKTYWEAFFIFKDLKLTQLDIIANVVAEEKFKVFLLKLMPTLKWIDDVELQ
ncbi:Geranylgeranyl transferase type-2 subunit alpha like [Actinidia chinensis var. chinensis]|uniref:Geranylgeranyl transferase type-2 subunit alpha n=1 Tax=Actinidia chinensis var. chinensis TaxID=1590841 RepID=A0A2R6R2Y0_ACTCC|nr:Geranylgeranyl transferase type-2 subunit alpha like [Actinidia chinensis var. chinensis]